MAADETSKQLPHGACGGTSRDIFEFAKAGNLSALQSCIAADSSCVFAADKDTL